MRDIGIWPRLNLLDLSRRDAIKMLVLGSAGALVACYPSTTTPAITPSQPKKDIPEIRAITTEELKRAGWQHATIDLPHEPPKQLAVLTVPIPVGATFYYIPFNSAALAAETLGQGVSSIEVWTRTVGQIAFKGVMLNTASYLATQPRVIQDMAEGPIQYTWNGQMITVDSVDGRVDARPLQRVEVKEKVEDKDRIRPTDQPRRIALIDDDPDYSKSMTRMIPMFITRSTILSFPDCESLLNSMKSGKRFDVYLVDYNMGNGLLGPACTVQILSMHPGAIVVGISANDVSKQFADAGAKFVSKRAGPTVLTDLLESLLK